MKLLAIVAFAAALASPLSAQQSRTPPSPDPRIGLRPGWFDAGTAEWNMHLVSNTRPSADSIMPAAIQQFVCRLRRWSQAVVGPPTGSANVHNLRW